MHYQPRTIMPENTQRKWNALANVGVGLSFIAAIFTGASHFKTFQHFIQKNVTPEMWLRITKNGSKKLSDRGWQLVGLAGIFQGINRYETAANTNQPSKQVGSILNTIQMVAYLFSSHWIVQSLTFLKGAFLYAGEKNDIDNSNHPDRRREWETSRITKPLLAGEYSKLPKEFASAGKFIIHDIQNAFSKEHWQALAKTTHYNKKDWLTPQSYQSALGMQASFASFVAYIASSLLPIKSSLFNSFKDATNLFAVSIPQTPLVLRAWENRDQIDGKLVLAGAPLIVLGRVFQVKPQTEALGSMGPVGDALKGKGLALNSQKYLSLITEMRNLYTLSKENPYLTAEMILDMLTTAPDIIDQLQLKMGQPRLRFLLKLLKQATIEYKHSGTTLQEFLAPILEIQEHSLSPFQITKNPN